METAGGQFKGADLHRREPARRQGFKDFIVNQGCDILHPGLRNSGGFLETKRIADMAAVFGLPMSNHNTASQVMTYATIPGLGTELNPDVTHAHLAPGEA